MGLKDAFKGIGRALARVFSLIQKLVPDEQLVEAIRLVSIAATKFATSPEKREWVVAKLAGQFHISESVARLITEIAFQHVKHGIEVGEQKLEDKVTEDNPPKD